MQPTAVAAAQPAVVPAVSKSVLPRPPHTGFVARLDENGRDILERLKDELLPNKEQLIVLCGPGGVGKTTLAAETARAMRNVFDGGIIWSSADGKPDYSLSTLLDEIAINLERPDLRQLAPGPKDEEVHLALSRAPNILIVLDNLETVSPEQQEKCAEWLANRASCPALITSRDEVSHARPIHILAMSLSEAREFLRRLIADTRNRHVFAEVDHEQILQAADRIPLLLQWVVQQIDSAKQPRLVLDELLHGRGNAAKRVFDRSFDLPQLGDDGRATLLALSLFVPSASRVALREVAGLGANHKDFERAIRQLVELSLIRTGTGNERLRVEGLTRELAKARLHRERNTDALRTRFINYFLEYVQAHAAPEDYKALEDEKENLLNSMDMAFELKNWESVFYLANRIASPVSGFLSVCGYWAAAVKTNQQALEAARESHAERETAAFAHNLAMMYDHGGELEKARQLYNESLEIKRTLGDERGIATSLHQLGVLAHHQGELTEARALYNESLEIKRKIRDSRGIASSLHQLARLSHDEGDLTQARGLYNESLEIKRKRGDQRGIANSLHQLGMLAHDQGELTEARALYNESLEIERKLGNQRGIAESLHQLGVLAHQQGELVEARALYNGSLEIEKNLGNQHGIAVSWSALASIEADEKNVQAAIFLFRDALEIFDRLKSPSADGVRRALKRLDSPN